ncbi:MAG: sulfatase [Labilithrix sp.]|nr:sulfatase [Labilithrix sp.]MCW5814303.1 sulfatase [Labilithrix sp.]
MRISGLRKRCIAPRLECHRRGVACAVATLAFVVACDRGGVRPTAQAIDSAPAPVATPSASVAAPAASDAGGGAGDAAVAVASAAGIPKDLNVIVLSVDSLRADMPWNGYPRPIAPRLTALEKRAVSYTHAYAISSYTSMSLGGLLGGKLPSGMKRSGYFFGKYSQDNLMFPEVLQSAGVRTMAGHAHGYFNGAGFDQGFDAYEVVAGISFDNTTDRNVTSPQHEAIAEKQLGDPALDGKRFFAWYHFLDPHDQYLSHEADGIPPFGKTLRDRYDAEVLYTDRYLGKLLDFIDGKPWGKRTAIIVTADHGEAFGEHGQTSHGFELWENLVRVPMFLVVPGVAPKRIDTPRSAIDLAPTILELLGVSAPAELSLEGKSLVGEMTGKEEATERDVILDLPMTSDSDKRRALVRGKDKIIAFGEQAALRLYDVAADPEEKKPITKGETFDTMAKRYREIAKTIKEVPPYQCNVGCLNRAYATKKK